MAIRFTHAHVEKAYADSYIRLVGKYRNVFKKIHLICELCGHEWEELYDVGKEIHCPECRSITEKVEIKKLETEESPAQEKKSRRRSRKFKL